jgi:hypothetical protein
MENHRYHTLVQHHVMFHKEHNRFHHNNYQNNLYLLRWHKEGRLGEDIGLVWLVVIIHHLIHLLEEYKFFLDRVYSQKVLLLHYLLQKKQDQINYDN